MQPDPPELGNEDPVFLSLLERARAERPDKNPYPALWVRVFQSAHTWCGFSCELWRGQAACACGACPSGPAATDRRAAA